MEIGDKQLSTTLFAQFPIRRTWYEEEWIYSLVDVWGAITASPNARRYWSDFKRAFLKENERGVYAIGVHTLTMPDNTGRKQPTDCANMQTTLRLI